MRVTITGAGGMLGHALLATSPAELAVKGVDLEDGDLTGLDGARAALAGAELVIHCAAWADVDGCTRDPERAMLHNAQASGNVASVCQAQGARLIAISTDYVFDGGSEAPYVETDPTNPLSPYGVSKLAGEEAIRAILENHLIVRTQWLYGPFGRNFVATVVRRAREQGALEVVDDQWGSPTYTFDLAKGLWNAALSDARGTLHLTNSEVATWADLATAALAAAGLESVPVARVGSDRWPSPTVRPRHSVLSNRRYADLGFTPLRSWREAVRDYVQHWLLDDDQKETARP